jgi:hypothetical protein
MAESPRLKDVDRARARARLVASIAGSVAGGYTANPETSGEPKERIARWSVEVADAIVGLALAGLEDEGGDGK